MPLFYQEIVLGYMAAKIGIAPNTKDDCLKQPIWANKWVKTQTDRTRSQNTLYFQNGVNANIIFLSDLRINNGHLDEMYVYNKLLNKANYLREMHLVKKAIKPYLRDIQSHNPDTNFQEDNFLVNAKSKYYYNEIIKHKTQEAPSERKWRRILDCRINFKAVYKRKIIDVKEYKLSEFNYKVLHCILACGTNLFRWKKQASSTCNVCGEIDDISHLLFHCTYTKNIWYVVENILQITVSEKSVILGVNKHTTFNLVSSLIAFLIYKHWLVCKDTNTPRTAPALIVFFIKELKFRIAVYSKIPKIWNIDAVNTLQRIMDILSNNNWS
jgi:hypothetical protein